MRTLVFGVAACLVLAWLGPATAQPEPYPGEPSAAAPAEPADAGATEPAASGEAPADAGATAPSTAGEAQGADAGAAQPAPVGSAPAGEPRWGQPGYVPRFGGQSYSPGYGDSGYSPGYGSGAGYGPPPPAEPPPPAAGCCLFAARYDPFDLVFRRLTVEAELKIWGPITVQLAPAWIFDSPASDMTEHGFDMGADLAWYVQGDAFKGFWLKLHAEYEIFKATLTNSYEVNGAPAGTPEASCDGDSEPGTCSKTVSSMIVGALVGTSVVFGDPVGFTVSGGIGIGVALAQSVDLEVVGTPEAPGATTTYYDKTGRLRLLGSLGLGVAF